MSTELTDLRALVSADAELREVCAELLTVLAHGEVPVETLNFNEIDVTVNRNEGTLTFEGVLSINDTTIKLSESRFVELAGSITHPYRVKTSARGNRNVSGVCGQCRVLPNRLRSANGRF